MLDHCSDAPRGEGITMRRSWSGSSAVPIYARSYGMAESERYAHRLRRSQGTIRILSLTAAFFSLFFVNMEAQPVTGTIVATITDQTGGALPNVNVTVTNVGPGVTRQLATDKFGSYAVPLLPPGTYSITAVLSGGSKGTA